MQTDQIAVSPCSRPAMPLDEVLAAYAAIGYRRFEIFTAGLKSAFDYKADPEFYISAGARHGMQFLSLHLPPIRREQMDETLADAVRAAEFAAAIGVKIVLYKAADRPTYIEAAGRFLDAIAGLDITPVVQNHFGTPTSSLDNIKEVMEGIGDERMKSLLEVGQYHSAGVTWREAAEYLGGSIALVHIKDQIGPQSVPFGKGEVDLPGLFAFLDDSGYNGCYVVEMEVEDPENTLKYLEDAMGYMKSFCKA